MWAKAPRYLHVWIASFPASAIYLACAILLYGVSGSPTPDSPGWAEAGVGMLLVMAVCTAGLTRVWGLDRPESAFMQSLRALFLFGLIIPTLSGLFRGNDLNLMMRDILPFLFLSLPLFLSENIGRNPRAAQLVLWALAGAGLLFCLRTLLPVLNIWIPQGELLYLSNSPLALFAALMSLGVVLSGLEKPSFHALVRVCGGGAVLTIITSAMLLDVQRATLGAIGLSLIVWVTTDLIRSPRRTWVPLTLIAGAAGILWPVLGPVFEAMAAKTAVVGLNARVEEAHAVYEILHRDFISFLFGHGWGATFSSPAVAGLEVNYTHSFFTSIMLKGGLVLLVPACTMALCGLREIFLIFQQNTRHGMTLFWPFIIPLVLYASHKSLDFGLILFMIAMWSVRGGAWTEAGGSGKTGRSENP